MLQKTAYYCCFILFAHHLPAQITVLPYHQSFDEKFQLSEDTCTKEYCEVEFLPSWSGNEVRTNKRIYKDTIHFKSAPSSLSMAPTAQYKPEVIVKFTLEKWKKLLLTFHYKSLKNGKVDDTYPSLLLLSYSINSGKDFSEELLIDTLKNVENSDFRMFEYTITNDLKWENLWIRMKLKRAEGSGTGLSAKVVLDEFSLQEDNSATFVSKSDTKSKSLFMLSEPSSSIPSLKLNRSISGYLSNSVGMVLKTVKNESEINFQNLPQGLYFLNTDDGVCLKIVKGD